MTKLFTYFKTPGLHISQEMRNAIKEKETQGLRGMPLTTKSPNLKLRNIQVHLQEPRYNSFFEVAKSIFRRSGIRIEYINSKEETVEETLNKEVEEVVEEPTKVEETLDAPEVEDPSLDVTDRQSKARDADIYVETNKTKPTLSQLKELANSVKEKGNNIKVFGLSVDDLPPAEEIQFELVQEKIRDFSEVRAIITDTQDLVLIAIAEGIPVFDLNQTESLEEFTVVEITEVSTARVANKEARQEFFESL